MDFPIQARLMLSVQQFMPDVVGLTVLIQSSQLLQTWIMVGWYACLVLSLVG